LIVDGVLDRVLEEVAHLPFAHLRRHGAEHPFGHLRCSLHPHEGLSAAPPTKGAAAGAAIGIASAIAVSSIIPSSTSGGSTPVVSATRTSGRRM